MAKDYYSVLGLSKDASQDDIKKAYRQLSKELHPDKHPSTGSVQAKKDAESKFKEVNEAYEVLSNPEKKQMYDQFGTADKQQAGFGAGGFGGFDFSGFSGQGSPFGDIFESFFGGGRGGPREEKGTDLEVEITIDFADVVTGATKKLSLRRQRACETCKGSGAKPGSKVVTCSECGGTGQVTRSAQSFFGTIQQRFVCPRCKGSGKVPEEPCGTCKGEGRVSETSTIEVKVPSGIHDGQTLRLRGEGDAGRTGTAAGDLYVHIRVRPDPRFERDGDDIRTETPLSAVDAILGTEIPIETVHGAVTLKIPEGTQPHQIFRLKGKGLPVLNSSRFGDHYVTVDVEIPKKLSRAERKLVEEWKAMQ
ncbi:molecular chaperone DnaJ [Candidatus Peregrinibacteria bacterium]|nr:molecular chaperone DnaJ [Candidatus Peregrinibacteria bacterium]